MLKDTLLLLVLLPFLCAIAAPEPPYQNFEHDGMTRQYLYYAPENLPENAPLVIVMHGFTSNAMASWQGSGMNAVADEHGFAVCYPQGSTDAKGNTFWNVGYDFHQGVTVDDVGFLTSLVKYLQQEHHLSPENTFATGHSNGGEMCYLLACEASDVFRAVAPVSGMMLKKIFDTCSPARPIPLFEIHGTADGINRYGGDITGADGWGAYPDIPYTIDYWVKQDQCTVTQIDTLPDIVSSDSSFVISEKHLNGLNGCQVWLYKIINGGHEWPGESGNQDINTAREIWSFFAQFITE